MKITMLLLDIFQLQIRISRFIIKDFVKSLLSSKPIVQPIPITRQGEATLTHPNQVK